MVDNVVIFTNIRIWKFFESPQENYSVKRPVTNLQRGGSHQTFSRGRGAHRGLRYQHGVRYPGHDSRAPVYQQHTFNHRPQYSTPVHYGGHFPVTHGYRQPAVLVPGAPSPPHFQPLQAPPPQNPRNYVNQAEQNPSQPKPLPKPKPNPYVTSYTWLQLHDHSFWKLRDAVIAGQILSLRDQNVFVTRLYPFPQQFHLFESFLWNRFSYTKISEKVLSNCEGWGKVSKQPR